MFWIFVAYWTFGILVSFWLMEDDSIWDASLKAAKAKHPELYKDFELNVRSTGVRIVCHVVLGLLWPYFSVRRMLNKLGVL